MVRFSFQRDKKTDDGDDSEEVYLYYKEIYGWRLAGDPDFRSKSTTCWMYLVSSGKKSNVD